VLLQMAALPRYAAGDKIASLVAYLASPEAACLTGAGLSIDGIGLLVSVGGLQVIQELYL
jgi:NAD(P)-dependent dehydrogenase (short-subunit alcohol dehydrogenase family)